MKRVVEPEILDSLPEQDPAAVANRRDLRLINTLMGNYRWFASTLSARLGADDRILEIGAGTGEMLLHLRKKLARSPAAVGGLDLWSRPPQWPQPWHWHREDLLTFSGYSDYTALLANLILHQFSDEDLGWLGQAIDASSLRLIVASEPARRRLHQHQLRLLYPLGLHPISRHDGRVSIAAGFRGDELPRRLGLSPAKWEIQVSSGFLGWYRMVAVRKASV